MQKYFRVSPPSVHQMVLTLEANGFIERVPGQDRSMVKGKQLYVEGRLSARSYEKDGRTVYVTEVVADQVILLGGPGSEK